MSLDDPVNEPADDTSWVPPGVDKDKVSVARVYDYYLGGTHNFSADRDMGRSAIAIEPTVSDVARANRSFLGRVVRFMIGQGIRQFVDIGSGIPTQDNVHEVAQRAADDTRVVYVDNDPVAVGHSRAMLAGNDRTAIVQEDMRRPDDIFANPIVREMVDLDRPVGLLCFYVLHFVTDAEDPAAVTAAMRDHVAPGSYLALSHITRHGQRDADVEAGEKLYKRASSPIRIRDRNEIEAMFTGFELVEPGVVFLPEWRSDGPGALYEDDPRKSWALAGVGRKY